MQSIGLLYHANRSESVELARHVERSLCNQRRDVWLGTTDDETGLQTVAPDLDLILTFGGDGTIVLAVRAMAEHGVPVLGVNLGRLGFLAEVEPDEIDEALPALFEGRYLVEERMMLRAEVRRGDDVILVADAINDVVMARGRVSRTVRISVDVDEHHVFSPTCDGMIVATPTGSTAYCLAAGGPIVAPDLHCLTMVPVAAHLGIAHSLVIPAHRELRLGLLKGADAMVTVDGQIDLPLQAGDCLCSTASEKVARFVRFAENGYFYETVLRRLGWADRP